MIFLLSHGSVAFMKTKAPFRIKVLLVLTAGALICQSAQAGWQKDMVLGTGGGYSAPPVYYNPGPSPEQIAAQQAAQLAAQQAAQQEAERQARMHAAHNNNDAGLACFNKKDWAAAADYFQRALENSPGNPTLISNLAKAREQLAEQRREEARKVADTSAASDMKDAINQASNSIQTSQQQQPQQLQQQQQSGGGLAFVPADGDSDNTVTIGAFGNKQSDPHLEQREPRDPNVPKNGTDIKAIDQLTSIARKDKTLLPGSAASASYNSQSGIDTIGTKSGSVSDVKVDNPSATVMLPKLLPEESANPIIKQDVDNYNKWAPQLQQAREDVKKAQEAVKTGKDPGALATLKAAQAKSDGLQVAVESTVAEIADTKKKIQLAPFAVSGQAPAGQGKSLASGSAAPPPPPPQ